MVAVEDAQGVALLEVLPLDHATGPDLGDAGHEGLDQLVVLGAAEAGRAIAEIERVGQEGGVVRPNVERDGERQRRMDAAGGRVQGELADRDAHAAGTLVAKAEDPLVVGDDDQPDVLVRPLAEELGDAIAIGRRDPDPARAADDVAELHARPPDRGRVDDRQELREVIGQEPVEQGRVPVLERREADVRLEGVALAAQVLELQCLLLLDRQDPIREQPVEPEQVTLRRRERQVLGQQAAAEQRRAGEPDLGGATRGDIVERSGERTHRAEHNRAAVPFANAT